LWVSRVLGYPEVGIDASCMIGGTGG